jgi:Uma2 family endonuclease
MSVRLIRHRFSADDFHALARAGVLGEQDRVELVEGEIVDMTPLGRRHVAAVNLLTRRFTVGCGERAVVQIQGPLRLGTHSEVQPDVVVLRPRDDFYRDAAPTVDDVLLVVEVADTSLLYDRTVKVPLYARAGVCEVWLVNQVDDQVEVFRDPTPAGYLVAQARSRAERLAPLAFPDLLISVNELVA